MKTRKSCRGFTLFEIVIALAILGMLSATVFGIMWKVGDAADEIRTYDQRDEQISRFLGLLRRTIESLPSTGKIALKPPEETASGYYEMTISQAPTAFHFGEDMPGDGTTVIGLRLQTAPPRDESLTEGSDTPPLFEVAISRDDFAPSDTDGDGMVFGEGGDDAFLVADEEGRYWLPVLDNVTELSWRFWDKESREWTDLWQEKNLLPELLEMSLDDPYHPAPIRLVFEVPSHLSNPPKQTQPATAAGATSGATAGQTPNNGGAGGTGNGRPGEGGGNGRPGDGKGGGRPGGDGKGGGRPGGGGGAPPGNPGGGGGGGGKR
jgi:prepilin-type N-terminal cleavage/methylation domain-containing protein